MSAQFVVGDDDIIDLGGFLAVNTKGEILVVKVLVHNTSHSILTVLPLELRTIKPDGTGILYDNLKDIRCLYAHLGSKIEAAKETDLFTEAVQKGLAGLQKTTLSHTVVCGKEMPLDNVSSLSYNVVRIKPEASFARDNSMSDSGEVVRPGRVVTGGGSRGSGNQADNSHNNGNGSFDEHSKDSFFGVLCRYSF